MVEDWILTELNHSEFYFLGHGILLKILGEEKQYLTFALPGGSVKDGLEKKTDKGQGDPVGATAKIQVKEAEAEPRQSECELKKQWVHSPIVNSFLFYMILIVLHLYPSKFKRNKRKYSESLPPMSCPHSIPHSRGSFLYILLKMFYT